MTYVQTHCKNTLARRLDCAKNWRCTAAQASHAAAELARLRFQSGLVDFLQVLDGAQVSFITAAVLFLGYMGLGLVREFMHS